jgi:hypothetical protein
MSKKKLNSMWSKGAQRHVPNKSIAHPVTGEQLTYSTFCAKFREGPGWHRGAKVSKK